MSDYTVKRMYRAFGLNLLSDFALPELSEATDNEVPIDVVIESADLTREWEDRAGGERIFLAGDDAVLFRVAGTATYFIQDGSRIVVSPVEGADPDQVRLYLLGSSMGALLMQRRILPLHGSAVAVNGKAIAFVGESGAGKSTLASAFLRRGYPLMSDDVIPVTLRNDGIPYITPSCPQQKLWQDSLNGLGMDESLYKPIFRRETKFAVSVRKQFSCDSMPLDAVFEIAASGEEAGSLQRIERMARFATLFKHTYRNNLIKPLNLLEWHFDLSAKIVNRVEIFRYVRSSVGFTADDMVSRILDALQSREEAER